MTNIWTPRDNLIVLDDDVFGGLPAPIFFALFADLGAGIASIAPAISYGTVTFFSRASAAWTRLQSGLWTSIAAGQPRSYYGCTPGTLFAGRYDGILLERSSQNNCLWSRDWTNAAWTKTNMTAVKDATGIDGVANSATRLVANANNATVVQNSGVNNCHSGMFIKRISGTGTIELQIGAATFVNVTAQVAVFGTDWSSLIITSPNGATPTYCGIRLGTAGDQIAVDMAQVEDKLSGANTSPIPTTAAADVRFADTLNYANFAFNPLALSFGITVSPIYAPNSLTELLNCPMSTSSDINNYTTLRHQFVSNTAEFDINRAGVITQAFGFDLSALGKNNPANLVGSLSNVSPNAAKCFWNENTFLAATNSYSPAKCGTILDFNRMVTTGAAGDSFAVKNARVYNVGLDAAQVSTLQKNQY